MTIDKGYNSARRSKRSILNPLRSPRPPKHFRNKKKLSYSGGSQSTHETLSYSGILSIGQYVDGGENYTPLTITRANGMQISLKVQGTVRQQLQGREVTYNESRPQDYNSNISRNYSLIPREKSLLKFV
ncbi:hypothetical protein KW787_01625 [Candidatus Pacearchaeota archaeon]|nr:hypothetical protein [Candidatus Pacearchaeota archaeon]